MDMPSSLVREVWCELVVDAAYDVGVAGLHSRPGRYQQPLTGPTKEGSLVQLNVYSTRFLAPAVDPSGDQWMIPEAQFGKVY
jgi:hypothetical protein